MSKALTRIDVVRRSLVDQCLYPVGTVEVPTCGIVKVILNQTSLGEVMVESSEIKRNDGFEEAREELEKSLARLNHTIEEFRTNIQHAMTDMYQFHKWSVPE